MKNSITTTLIYILLVSSVYAQTMSLHSVDEDNKEFGIVSAYNQHEFPLENGYRRSYSAHFSLDRMLIDITRLSLVPCFSYIKTEEDDVSNGEIKFTGCHFRYTQIITLGGQDFKFFHREEIGIVSDPIEADSYFSSVLTGELSFGGGLFYNFKMGDHIYTKPFIGFFLKGDAALKNIEQSNETGLYAEWDPFCEFGIEAKFWKDKSVFATWSTSLIKLDPKFYVGIKIY